MYNLEYIAELYTFAKQAADERKIWWKKNSTYLISIKDFEKLINTIDSLRIILDVPFKDLPTYFGKCKSRPYIGGWEGAVLTWRLETGR